MSFTQQVIHLIAIGLVIIAIVLMAPAPYHRQTDPASLPKVSLPGEPPAVFGHGAVNVGCYGISILSSN